MTIVEREEQIIRIKEASFQSEMDEQLEKHVREQVVAAVQATLEAALVEEMQADRATMTPPPRRSGYFGRTLDTQYGRIARLLVPKLHHSNKERNWTILERYQRSLGRLLDFAGYLSIMGLSLRDLQEALYFLLGSVLSATAVIGLPLKYKRGWQPTSKVRWRTRPPSCL